MANENTKEPEKMMLSHKPVAGYPRAFVITIVVAVLYLAYIFITSV